MPFVSRAVQAPLNLSGVPMSVVVHGRSIAFAAFNETANQIILEEFVTNDYDGPELSEMVLSAIKPTLVLISSKIVSDSVLMEALTTAPPTVTMDHDDAEEDEDDDGDEANGDNDPPNQRDDGLASQSIPYKIMKTASYDLRSCKAMIMSLRVKSLLHGGPQQRTASNSHHNGTRTFPHSNQTINSVFQLSKYHSLASLIDFDSAAQVQALGSLLSFLQTSNFRFEQAGGILVDDIVRANASMYMTISHDAFSALQIFSTEHHPLMASKGSGNSKEGFSLFSLLDRTESASGRRMLREWMLKPLVDVESIQLRQNGVECFLMRDIQAAVASVRALLKNIGGVEMILTRLLKCSAQPNDFLMLSKSLSAAVAIMDTLREDILWKLKQRAGTDLHEVSQGLAEFNFDPNAEHHISFIEDLLVRCDAEALQSLFQSITTVIDEDAMDESNGAEIVIRMGYNEELDTFKYNYDCLEGKKTLSAQSHASANPSAEETLANITSSIVQEHPQLKDVASVTYLPQIGFLVRVHNLQENNALPEDYAFAFYQDEFSYFRADVASMLDEKVGDLDSRIKDIENTLIGELEDKILDDESQLRGSFEALAELDCILAFADCASRFDYVRPEILPAEEGRIEIQHGRHPLQELIVRGTFVPNDVRIDLERRVNIVTGPNFSGKSCYARQVGILTFMAQIGCFIPCTGARISVVDTILARFSTAESCTVPQSSFQLDLTQLGGVLRRASKNSLIIVDEFGKAALKHLIASGARVVCTTHFLEIFSMNLIEQGEHTGVQALQMKVQIPENPNDAAVPLFILEAGVANSSAGIVCASMAGVKRPVIDRASEIVRAMRNNEKVQPLVEILRKDLALSKNAKNVLREFVGKDWDAASDSDIAEFLSAISAM